MQDMMSCVYVHIKHRLVNNASLLSDMRAMARVHVGGTTLFVPQLNVNIRLTESYITQFKVYKIIVSCNVYTYCNHYLSQYIVYIHVQFSYYAYNAYYRSCYRYFLSCIPNQLLELRLTVSNSSRSFCNYTNMFYISAYPQVFYGELSVLLYLYNV